jgi:hypothetical protein
MAHRAGSPTKNLPRAVLRPKGINAEAAGLVSTRRQIISSKGANDGRRPLSHVRVAILALAPTDLTVDSLKASALFDLLVPPLHMVGLGVVLP